jgi:serine/threonine protein kinase/Tol biopolymer transport system component
MIGQSLLHYEITEKLGKGGMGEVFRARDTKLGRDVAIKVLPAELSGDPEREGRFQREARALASLQHPNVASVYGFEEVDGVRFLVMELIAGEELSDRIERGPITVDEALVIARQIASGLEAAHENGIVHRDLKPANIMETPEGEVKILDFGLAQAWFGDDGTDTGSSAAPTITAAMTQAGAILGTAAYMSPEQARGATVDRRADIWAFGVILFEMLTGKQLFQGDTVSDTLAAVLRKEPEWDTLPVKESPALCHLIERCLERNPKQRLRDIGEARIFLQDPEASGSRLSLSQLDLASTPAAPGRTRQPIVLVAAVAVVCLAIGSLLGWKVVASPEPPPVLHTMIPPPLNTEYDLSDTAPGPAALSPDGKMVAYTATDDAGVTQLYLRHLNRGESVPISGTDNAAYPFWSPDGQFIGFFDMNGGKLRKVAVAGGPPVTLCPAGNGKGGSWNRHGDIIFTPESSDEIFRVPAIGGEPVRLTTIEEGYNSHRHPRFLPDGEHYLFIARTPGSDQPNGVYLASLDTTIAPRRIAESQANADYADGQLLTVREGVLMATPFDPSEERVTDGGTPLVEDILLLPGAAIAVFSPSSTGMLVFQTGASAQAGSMLYWTDIENAGSQAIGEAGQIAHPAVSPDGKRAVIEVRGASNEGTDLWLVDLETSLRTRFTFAVGDELAAVWSRDGEYVFYMSAQEGTYRIIQQPVEGQSVGAIIVESEQVVMPTSLAPGDQDLLLNYLREDDTIDMRRLSLTDDQAELEIVAAAEGDNLGGGVYSPDGRWIAYHTETAAAWDVFVMPAGGGSRKWQVTSDGAVYPKWSEDGTELWVSRFNGDVHAFAVDGRGETLRIGGFRETVNVTSPDASGCYYDLHPDGVRILQTGIDPAFQAEVSYLHLVTDWQRGLVQ